MALAENYINYRSSFAQSLVLLREDGQRTRAKKILDQTRPTMLYKVAEKLYRKPNIFQTSSNEGYGEDQNINGTEKVGEWWGYYLSNEYYTGLAKEVRGLGGVGLAVGSDQGLDFFNMANLNEMYCIDIDPKTHIVTQGYL